MYFSIAGFFLKIEIPEGKLHSDIISIIKSDYSGLISNEKSKRIDFTIKIQHIHLPLIDILKGPSEFLVLKSTDRNSSFNYLLFFQEKKDLIVAPAHISIYQFLYIVIYLINKLLLDNGGFILHSSASIIDNKAVLFIGESGSGKSTVVRLLRKRYEILADDTIIVRKVKNRYLSYASLMTEKFPYSVNRSIGYEIANIYILTKSNKLMTKAITNKKTLFTKLFSGVMKDPNNIDKQKRNLREFFQYHKKYSRLFFRKNEKNLGQFIRDDSIK